jgi:hypothetical protein
MRILITGARTFADVLDAENAAAARRGLTGRFSSPHDAFARSRSSSRASCGSAYRRGCSSWRR